MTDLPSIVSLKNIDISFGKKVILDDLSLNLVKGEILSILGASGSGKSTLIKVLLGLLPPDRGTVSLFGKNFSRLSLKEKAGIRKTIGISFQQGALFDFLTVGENLMFAIKNMTNLSDEEAKTHTKDLLRQVNLPDVSECIPAELSGGMRRRVGIARAIATNPQLFLFDEPAAGLDPVTTTLVIEMIKKLVENLNSTMVCVTSNVDAAFRFSSEVAILHNEKIIGKGTREELLALKNDWLTEFLTVRNI